MISKNYTVLLLFFIVLFCNAQESIKYKSNSYSATPNWEFICNSYVLSGAINIQIASTETGGILKLAVNTTDENFIISGNVYVDLKDVSFILCTDKNYREYTNGQAITYYNFTVAEMKRLKTTNIQDIRFNISGKKNTFSNQVGNFTAINKSTYFSTIYDNTNKIFETAAAISLL